MIPPNHRKAISDAITSKQFSYKCNMCGSPHYRWSGYYSHPSTPHPFLSPTPPGNHNIPTIAFTCTNCGLVSFHDISVLNALPANLFPELRTHTVLPVGEGTLSSEPQWPNVRGLLGTCIEVHRLERSGRVFIFLATCLHVIVKVRGLIIVVIPRTQGNVWEPQRYPDESVRFWTARLIDSNPFADLAIMVAELPLGSTIAANASAPLIAREPIPLRVGSEVAVLGYPFAPMNSLLETRNLGYVTAIAKRQVHPSVPEVTIDELVLSITAHPGLSGAAVVDRHTGLLCGVLRGSLAPPPLAYHGLIPYGTDTTVTLATSAYLLHDLIANSCKKLESQL